MKQQKEPMILGYSEIMTISGREHDRQLKRYARHVERENRKARRYHCHFWKRLLGL